MRVSMSALGTALAFRHTLSLFPDPTTNIIVVFLKRTLCALKFLDKSNIFNRFFDVFGIKFISPCVMQTLIPS